MRSKTIVKRVIDLALTVTLLLLMAFQVTQQFAHEWLGITMFALTIIHQILNRNFYAAIIKGRYSPLRIFQLVVNILLLLSFVCTALSGMMMSRFATPFMNGILPSSIVRLLHMAMSHWSFVLMGLHLGLHFGIIASKLKKRSVRIIIGVAMAGISVYGFYLFFKAGMPDYMLFKTHFAFLDYSKAWWLVIIENLAMLLAWGFAAYLLSMILRKVNKSKAANKTENKNDKGENIMSKKLVAFFSASGTTASVAKNLANAAGADLYEIKPAVPYSKADLNWMDKQSRSSVEMRDKSSRPELADTDANIADYDTIFVGFPIWWYIAPTIINSFLEAYDFSGKKIVLFATSGGSGFGKAVESLQPSAPKATITEGEILNGRPGNAKLKTFADKY